MDKTSQTSDWRGNLLDDQIRYAAMDAVVVRRLAEKQGALLIAVVDRVRYERAEPTKRW